MQERTGQILEAAIQEFIDTGEPVSSGWLYKRYDFGIKPAMIRLELDALEEAGYLKQPYHSAGRVPTDSGYEFYAKRALALMRTNAEMHTRARAKKEVHESFAKMLDRRDFSDLLGYLSAELGLLSVALDPARDMIHKMGLEALINRLDWEDHEGIRSVIHDFESVDERLSRATEKIDVHPGAGPQIFIGKKSPLTESEYLSVVAGTYQVGDAIVSIFAIGPKRMDYKKTIELFNTL